MHSSPYPWLLTASKAILPKLHRIFLVLSVLCFVVAGYLVWQRYFNPFPLDFSSAPPPTVSKITFLPTRIQIPDLQIDLPVIPAQIVNGHWQTTSSGVSYLTTSARPGQPGNSIFYGHNWPRLLGGLKKIKPGSVIIINTSADHFPVLFRVIDVKTVSPTDVSILASTTRSQLTLYTCTGFSDSLRLVVIAYPQVTEK